MDEKTILYDSDEAASYKTGLEGWVNSSGNFWGKNEHMARWSGCTHKKCECGNVHSKNWICCKNCSEKKATERFKEFEKEKWNGIDPICVYNSDIYFFHGLDELEEYCAAEELKKEDLLLCFCEGLTLPSFDIFELLEDYLCDEHTIYDLPVDAVDAVDALNEALKDAKPLTWHQVDKAVIL